MSDAKTAFHEVYPGETLDPFIAEREEAAFVAGYKRALEDAADVAEHNAKWGLTREARHFGKVYAKLFRDRASSVGRGTLDANVPDRQLGVQVVSTKDGASERE